MIPLTPEQQQALEAICRRYEVARLELFGSAAKGGFDPVSSDLDLLVEFQDEKVEGAADRYFGLLDELEGLFGRRIDLVTPRSIRNPCFRRSVYESRAPLYHSA